MRKIRNKETEELLPGGDYTTLNILFMQAFLYTFNQYMVVPSIFEYSNALGFEPTTAGLLLAMTPLSTSCHAIV